MATWVVGVISAGGADAHKITVRATSESAARAAALVIAHANAGASGKPYKYTLTSANSK